MKYLAHPEATLTTSWVVARHLSVTGTATEPELFAALRPAGLTSGQGLALSSSLEVGSDLGLFEWSGQAVPRLSNTRTLSSPEQWVHEFDAFAGIARRLLMDQAHRRSSDQSDVALAVAWLLSRDWRFPHDPLSKETGISAHVATPDQLTSFIRWCRELGFSGALGSGRRLGVAPDPTSALRRDLKLVPPGLMTARTFVDLVAASIPAGPRHPLARTATAREDPRDDLEIYSSVGFAMKRLEREGSVIMRIFDDAPERIIFRFPTAKDAYMGVTHIEVVR